MAPRSRDSTEKSGAANTRPLAGLRIVEFDTIGPVPMAGMLLADLGANVVRLARPPGSGAMWEDVGGAVLHRGRPVVHLDLKNAADAETALSLIARADALIEGFRPGVMERLQLGPERCLTLNPRLVYTRLTGWGQTGPLSQRAGHDINYISITGVLHAIGDPDRPPSIPLNMVGDYAGGTMFALAGMLAALHQARTNGIGQVVDVAMTDGVAALSAFFLGYRASGLWQDKRGANLVDGSVPYYRCYRCADGRFIAVGSLEPKFFALLLNGLGLPADRFVQTDPSGWPAMAGIFEEIFSQKPRDYWAEKFAGTDACVTPVLDFAEAAQHPHNRARRAFIERAGAIHSGAAPHFSASSFDETDRVTELGADAIARLWT